MASDAENVLHSPQGDEIMTVFHYYEVGSRGIVAGSTLDCRSTGQVINPAPGAWFIPKFISLNQVVPIPV